MRFDHVARQVDDVKTTVLWYSKHLKAKVLKYHEDWAMLLIGNLTLALTKKGTHPDHIAFVVNSLDEFPCEEIDIKEHRDGSLYYYQETPDNITIEWLYWPRRDRTV